jgi:hypothetical protein
MDFTETGTPHPVPHSEDLLVARTTIATRLSAHAQQQAQRRGVARQTLDLVLKHADRSRKLPGRARALWVSPRARRRLISSGLAPSDVDRTRGVRIVVALDDDIVMTVEHMLARRAWV